MKKTISLIILLAAFALNAQSAKIEGNWLLYETEVNGKTTENYFIADFNADGKMYVFDTPMAEWKYDEARGVIVLSNGMDEDFNGDLKITKLDDEKLTLEKNGAIFRYEKLDPAKLAQSNAASGLFGIWEGKRSDGAQLIFKFEKPNDFTIVLVESGSTETVRGTWIYSPKDNSVILMSFSPDFRGKKRFENLDENGFALKLFGEKISVAKKADVTEEKNSAFARLDFAEEDFDEIDLDEQINRLPWKDFDAMAEFFADVSALEYDYDKYLNETGTFANYGIISKVKVDREKPAVRFTNLFIEQGDTSQFAEKYKGGLTGMYDNFFPQAELMYFRVAGEETLKVPAGEFRCVVVEGIDGETKVKYWMAKEEPGVYVKIVKEEVSPFDENEIDYTVQTLKKIVKK